MGFAGPRYVVADETKGQGWPHIFPGETTERICSFVYDKEDRKLLELTIDGRNESFFGDRWNDMKLDLVEAIALDLVFVASARTDHSSDPELAKTIEDAVNRTGVEPEIDTERIFASSWPAPFLR